MMDKVSVIIPTYQRFDTLFRAIDSVKNQSYKNIEIIVVDDNYEDLSFRNKIKEKIDCEYPDVKFITKSLHLGGAQARNVGVKHASAEFVAFLDDDDEFKPNKIEKQISYLNENNSISLVYCYGTIIYPNGQKEMENTSHEGNPLAIQMCFNIAGTSFWMLKKSILLKIGGFESIHSHQDGVVLLKLLANGYKIGVIKEDLVTYYAHDKNSGITGITEKNLIADEIYYEMCQRYFNLLTNKEKELVKYNYYKNRILDLLRLYKDDLAYKAKNEYLKLSHSFNLKLKLNFIWINRKTILKKMLKNDKKYGG